MVKVDSSGKTAYYEGDFVDGHFMGFGRYYFADFDKYYEGEFRTSNMEGKGIETWADGRRYEGDFKNGKKDGEGTFEWPTGTSTLDLEKWQIAWDWYMGVIRKMTLRDRANGSKGKGPGGYPV